MNHALLLCTDLDRTLIPNGVHPESPQARERFRRLVDQPHVTLVFVTGRHRELVQQGIRKYGLPMPDYVIADAGSSIYQVESGDWSGWQRWELELCRSWKHTTHVDLHSLFDGLEPLQLQELEKQNIFKLSYYLPLQFEQEALERELCARLESVGVEAALIWSRDEMNAVGLLDVMPVTATKQHAIEFLMQELGFGLENTIFAGDSGNDLSVLAGPINSILVANASDEVRQMALQSAATGTRPDALYLASGGFDGMNGNYSAGILEGVVHYMPQAAALLRR
jgi:sucrose-6-phosphatase